MTPYYIQGCRNFKSESKYPAWSYAPRSRKELKHGVMGGLRLGQHQSASNNNLRRVNAAGTPLTPRGVYKADLPPTFSYARYDKLQYDTIQTYYLRFVLPST